MVHCLSVHTVRYIITVENTRAWIKHLFVDLRPYSCLVLRCTTPHKLYSTQHDWVHHLNSVHGPGWMGTEGNRQDTPVACPLCHVEVASGKDSERHVARHFQELALFVLPRQDDDAGDEGSGEGSQVVPEDISISSGSISAIDTDKISVNTGEMPQLTYDNESQLSVAERTMDVSTVALSLLRLAETGATLGTGFHKFTPSISSSGPEIVDLISKCFAISAGCQKLAEIIAQTGSSPYSLRSARENEYLMESVEYTFKDIKNITGDELLESKEQGRGEEEGYKRAWRALMEHFEEESGNRLGRRMQYYIMFLNGLAEWAELG